MTSFSYFLRAEAAKDRVFQPCKPAPRCHSERAKMTDRYYEIMLWENSKHNFSLSPELEKSLWESNSPMPYYITRLLPWQKSNKFIKCSICSFCNFVSFMLYFELQVFQHLFCSVWINMHYFIIHYYFITLTILLLLKFRTEAMNSKTVTDTPADRVTLNHLELITAPCFLQLGVSWHCLNPPGLWGRTHTDFGPTVSLSLPDIQT